MSITVTANCGVVWLTATAAGKECPQMGPLQHDMKLPASSGPLMPLMHAGESCRSVGPTVDNTPLQHPTPPAPSASSGRGLTPASCCQASERAVTYGCVPSLQKLGDPTFANSVQSQIASLSVRLKYSICAA